MENHHLRINYQSYLIIYRGIDHCWQNDLFITCSKTVDVWNHMHNSPIQSFKWGDDTVTSVKYNPSDPNVICSTSYDRGISLYDVYIYI